MTRLLHRPTGFRSALVTGASGFVGAWLCLALVEAGVEVVGLLRRAPAGLLVELGLPDRPGIRFVEAERPTAEMVRDAAPDVVFHLAGLSQASEAARDPARAFEVNARGTWLLLDAVRAAGTPTRAVIVSTDAVYGEAVGGRPSVETDPLRGRNPYELSKAAGESAAFAFAATGLPVAVGRLGNVYGRGDPNSGRLVPSLLHAVRTGTPPTLRSATAIRGHLEISDCLRGLVALASADPERTSGRPFNIVSETPVSNLDLARLVLGIARRDDLEPLVAGTSAETSVRLSSAALARDQLGWRETVPLRDGLTRLLEPTPT